MEVLPSVQYASITMRHLDGTLDSYGLTDDLLADLDEQQYQLQEDPCYDATTDAAYVFSADVGADERCPHYGPVRCGRVSDRRRRFGCSRTREPREGWLARSRLRETSLHGARREASRVFAAGPVR